jgi:hypothetical protein
MSFVINDPSAVRTFAMAKEPIELKSPDGRVLGQFVPAAPSKSISFPELGITDEEFERRVNDRAVRWYTPEEVMARLRSLRKGE